MIWFCVVESALSPILLISTMSLILVRGCGVVVQVMIGRDYPDLVCLLEGMFYAQRAWCLGSQLPLLLLSVIFRSNSI